MNAMMKRESNELLIIPEYLHTLVEIEEGNEVGIEPAISRRRPPYHRGRPVIICCAKIYQTKMHKKILLEFAHSNI